MKRVDLEQRILALEKAVEKLQGASEPKPKGPWWVTGAGRFANDPVFDEIVRLGREYRESLRPGAKKKKLVKKKNGRT